MSGQGRFRWKSKSKPCLYGLWRLDPSGWRAWNVAQGDLPTNDLYEIAQSALPNGDRTVWVASRSGLIRVHNDQAQVFDRAFERRFINQ